MAEVNLDSYIRNQLNSFKSGLKLVHVNAQSLRVESHLVEFRRLFDDGTSDVVAVSESWLKPFVEDSDVELEGYKLLRCDRVDRDGGGVALYVKKNITASIVSSSDGTSGSPEFIFCSLGKGKNKILVVVVYRPPKIAFGSAFEETLLSIAPEFKHVVVTGDFNSDLTSSSFDSQHVKSLIDEAGLSILPFNPTHHTSTSSTWLDLIAVSDLDCAKKFGQIPVSGLSKHDLVYVAIKVDVPRVKNRQVTTRDFRSFDFEKFSKDLRAAKWDLMYSSNSADEKVSIFNRLFLQVVDLHAPIRTFKPRKLPAPWLSEEIKTFQRERDIAYRNFRKNKSAENQTKYKALRNAVNQKIRNAKLKWVSNKFKDKLPSSEFWSNVRNIGFHKSKNSDPITIDINELNKSFVGDPKSDPVLLQRTAKSYVNSSPLEGNDWFKFSKATLDEVKNALLSINQDSKGIDQIPVKLLKLNIDAILPHIRHIFNHSLMTNTFPSMWKSAMVRPIPKIKNPCVAKDYRPISLLCSMSKALEKIVHTQLTKHLTENNLMDPFQSGFRKNFSTTSALLKVTDDIRFAMDQKKLTFLILFDFSKAFDMVDHKILLAKLRGLKISQSVREWFSSYLLSRQQMVVDSDGNTSLWLLCALGVPQGSVLGPLLFSIYISGIGNLFGSCKYIVYADDLQIYFSSPVRELEEAVRLVQLDIDALCHWADEHGLVLNATKTKVLLIGYPRLQTLIESMATPKFKLSGVFLEYSNSARNLGLFFNKTLTWTDHFSHLSRKVVATLQRLRTFRSSLPLSVRKSLIQAMVFPLLDYGSIVFNDLSVTLQIKMQRLQNSCVRFVYNIPRFDHVTPYLERLGWLRLNSRRQLLTACLIHRVLASNEPHYLAEKFTFLGSARLRSNLSIPPHRTSVANSSFVVSGSRLWNKLPTDLKNPLLSHGYFKSCIRNLIGTLTLV